MMTTLVKFVINSSLFLKRHKKLLYIFVQTKPLLVKIITCKLSFRMIGGGVEGICGKCTPSFKNVKFLLESCWGEEHAEV